MTLLSFADCGRQLGIDPKTLRRWLAQAPFPVQPHPPDARTHGLSHEQLCWLAQAHHRSLPALAQQEPPQPAPSAAPAALPHDLCEVLEALRALPAQLAGLQEQLADLSQQLSLLTTPASTTRSRSAATPKVAGRGRTQSRRQPQRSSKAKVLALVEYAGEGRYVVISPQGGLVPIEPDSPAWFAWLTTCLSFRFVGSLGHLTAHRELFNVSRAVWRGHRKIRNRTYAVHLGKMESLTIATLEQAAATLHAHL